MKLSLNLLFLLLCGLACAGCEEEDIIQKKKTYDYQSEVAQLVADSSGIVSEVYTDTAFTVVPGVEQIEMHFLDMRGYTTRLFIQRIDLNTPGLSLEVGTPYDLPSYGSSQTVAEMARYADKPGHRVVGGVNGDFYDISNFVPRGPLHKNGEIIKDRFTPTAALPQQALSFFGILDDGKPHIGYTREYENYKSRLTEATGGGVLLMKDSRVVDNSQFPQIDPRIAIGYTAENIIYFVVVDGRKFHYSNGMSYEYLSKLFRSLDVHSALNLDGGGSSTMMIYNALGGVWQMRNQSSDGKARAVSNAWLVISDQP